MVFKQDKCGLFVYDTKASKRSDTELVSHLETTLLNTVRSNMEGFTRREVEEAKFARKLHAMVGRPSVRDFEDMVRQNLFPNLPITATSIKNAHTILGPDIAGLRGETTRAKPERVVTHHLPALPE